MNPPPAPQAPLTPFDLERLLREQNDGESWIDCERVGRAHRLRVESGTSSAGTPYRYLACTRCPVILTSYKAS